MSPEKIRVCSRALCCSHSLGNPSTKLSVKGKTSTLEKMLNFQFGFDFVNTNVLASTLCLALFHTRGQSPPYLLQGDKCREVSAASASFMSCASCIPSASAYCTCTSSPSCISSPSCAACHSCLAFGPCSSSVLHPLPNGAAHTGTTQDTVPCSCERLSGDWLELISRNYSPGEVTAASHMLWGCSS